MKHKSKQSYHLDMPLTFKGDVKMTWEVSYLP